MSADPQDAKALQHLGSLDKVSKETSSATKKILRTIEKASPALHQQMIVIRKSIEVFLRPIGDIMAKFIRPMAIWMIKFAVKWYQLFGTPAQNKTDQQDLKEQLISERESAAAQGDTKRVEELDKQIAEIEENTVSFWEKIKSTWSSGVNWIKDLLNWDQIVEQFKGAWSQISVLFSGEYWQGVWSDLQTQFSDAWEQIKQVFDFQTWKAEWENLWTDLSAVGDNLKKFFTETIPGWWQTLVNKFTEVWNNIKSIWDKAKEAAANIFSGAGNVVQQGINFLTGKGSKAVGGDVQQTGLYQLHAGEKVLTSRQASEGSQGSMAFHNVYNISATINSQVDIRDLARQLAKLQETELRRRTSY